MNNNNTENQDPILNEPTETKDVTVENEAKKSSSKKSSKEAKASEESTEKPSEEVTAESSDTQDSENSAAEEAEAAPAVVNENDKAPVHNPDDFDWSMDKAGFAAIEVDSKSDLADMYAKTIKSIDEKTIVTGRIVSINNDDVVLDIGFKSDGLVSLTEFRDMPDLKAGDEVEVYVDETENKLGQLVLSRKKAIQEGAWDKIVQIKETGDIIKGYIQARTKGGLVVDVLGMDAFLPGSQIDVKPVRDYDQFVGKTMEFKVVKVNELYKNVVISHKAIIEDDIEAQKAEMISKMEVGQVLEGLVKNMTSFGVFVDLGGLDGLLHITDISWGRIAHPSDVLELDQKIQVVVLEFDNEKKRISLGMKQLTPHPWDSMKELTAGEKVKGKVVTVADYGSFVEVAPGIEGLVHVSEMSWSQHLRNPSDFMKVGDEIEAVVLDIDKEEHKLSLGIKQLSTDPWDDIETKYPTDSKHTGIVRNLTNYGLFIELEEGVDGLVHVSDLSWSRKIKHPAEFTKKGENLEVVVLEIDRDNRRLSLGHKQIDENPWDTFASIFTVGTEHEATVSEINDRGVVMSLPYGVEGFAPKKHTKKEDKTELKMDETIKVRVIEFNKDAKRILISHTDIWKEAERAQNADQEVERKRRNTNTSKYVNKLNKGAERSTLGELDVLADLKAKMEKGATEAPKAKKETPKKEAPKKEAAEKEEPKAEVKEAAPKKAAKKATAKPEVVEFTAEEAAEKTKSLLSSVGEADGAKDDLKKISGIGPVYEKKLNSIGIYTYSQLSKLDADGIVILETLTKYPGRVERDNWIGQAKELNN